MPGDVRMLRDERFRRYWRGERATCGRGIAAATLAEIQRMVKGAVSREAFWTQGYLDPVEAFRGRSREAAAVRGHKELA